MQKKQERDCSQNIDLAQVSHKKEGENAHKYMH